MSEAVRAQLLERWELDPARVVTIRPGPGRLAGTAVDTPQPVPASYVLAVGALEPRKQPQLLVEAHARARAQGLRAGLVLAGDGPLRRRLEGADAVLLGRVSDPQLDALYAGALCVSCVSSDEGFGFTPLEAMTRGVPAVVSELGAFRETLGDAALRVDADDSEALADALLRLEREPGLRERLIGAGIQATSALSWVRAAEETRALLAEAAAA
jgi:glycosyltransferase involved in cell wall biosynthesis